MNLNPSQARAEVAATSLSVQPAVCREVAAAVKPAAGSGTPRELIEAELEHVAVLGYN